MSPHPQRPHPESVPGPAPGIVHNLPTPPPHPPRPPTATAPGPRRRNPGSGPPQRPTCGDRPRGRHHPPPRHAPHPRSAAELTDTAHRLDLHPANCVASSAPTTTAATQPCTPLAHARGPGPPRPGRQPDPHRTTSLADRPEVPGQPDHRPRHPHSNPVRPRSPVAPLRTNRERRMGIRGAACQPGSGRLPDRSHGHPRLSDPPLRSQTHGPGRHTNPVSRYPAGTISGAPWSPAKQGNGRSCAEHIARRDTACTALQSEAKPGVAAHIQLLHFPA